MKRFLFTTCLVLALPFHACAEGISLTIEGLRNDHGHVLVAVFDNARSYDALSFTHAVGFAEIPARKGSVDHVFATLTDGPYAIFLFHDENDDKDANHTGNTQLEGIGASGAPNPEDYPDFSQASVWPGPQRVRIHYDQ